jgi:chemotaxis protein methyltransferase CheR
MGRELKGWRVEMLATDLSTEVLEKAKSGIYSQFEVQRGLPVLMLIKYFSQVGEMWQIVPEVRSMVTYKPLNLLNDFSGLGTFDVVFCRNALYSTPYRKSKGRMALTGSFGDKSWSRNSII